jgi:hypothetical protein
MFRLILSAMLLLLSGHWAYKMYQIFTVNNTDRSNEIADQAVLISWLMLAVMFLLFIEFRIGEKNE